MQKSDFISQTIFLPDAHATYALGQCLAMSVLCHRPGFVLALVGDLGSGKTTLSRGFIRARTAVDEEVPSPTFTLVQTYDHTTPPIWHIDAWRIQDDSECLELGIMEALETALILVEWPERIASFLPPVQTLWLRLTEMHPSAQEQDSESSGRWATLAMARDAVPTLTDLHIHLEDVS